MRSYEESCALLDQIVGRCIREADFALSTLTDPEGALAPYDLNEDELDDFVVLRADHQSEARQVWDAIRQGILERQALSAAKNPNAVII